MSENSNNQASLFDNFANQDADFKVIPLILDNNQTIEFPHTDDNNNESLIIKSDKDIYTSFAGSDVYFSVTNLSDIEEDGILLFHFDQNFKRSEDDPSGITKPGVRLLEQRSDNNWSKHKLIYNNISINVFKLAKALEKKKEIPDTFDVSAGTQFKLASKQTAYFKAKISYPPGSEGEFWIETLGENGGYGLLDPWYSSQWTYRRKITISGGMVPDSAGNLSNFPLLFSETNGDFKHTSFGGRVASASAGVTGGGGDFVFTSSDGTTKLDHEIEKYASSSGQLIAWIEVPTLNATSDTEIYIYYGGPSTGATNQNKTGVWATVNNWQGVWHLNENTGTTNKDSTSNANNGTKLSATEPNPVTGKIGGAQDFDGSNDKISVTQNASINDLTTMTLSAWINGASFPGATPPRIIDKRNVNNNGAFLFYMNGAPVAFEPRRWSTTAGIWQTTVGLSTNTWYYVAVTYDYGSTANDPIIYVNGVSQTITETSAPAGTLLSETETLNIGNRDGGDRPFYDFIDEVRVSNSIRSDGWIKTEYNNQYQPTAFVRLGMDEKEIRTAPSAKFKGGVKIKGGVKVK